MQYQFVDLLCALNGVTDLASFAAQFFNVLGIAGYEERESSYYINEQYFNGYFGDIEYKIYVSYEEGNEDLPFKVFISKKIPREQSLSDEIVKNITGKFKSTRFHIALMLNHGEENEERIDLM